MRWGRLLSPRLEPQAEFDLQNLKPSATCCLRNLGQQTIESEDQPEMNGKVKFRIGDTVYHKTLDLGRGRVRYIYRTEVMIAFESSSIGRYPKEDICKSEPHPVELPQVARFVRAA
jgi:hypothetical protein